MNLFLVEYFPVVVDDKKFIRIGCDSGPSSKMYNIGKVNFNKMYYELSYDAYLQDINKLHEK